MTRRPSAAKRTVAIPGVDMREQRDQNAISNARSVRICVAQEEVRLPDGRLIMVKHYAIAEELPRALCGAKVTKLKAVELPKRVCTKCHAEASTMKAAIG